MRGVRKDYAEEDAAWYSLSVLHAICTPEQRRKIDLVGQVPSVFVTVNSEARLQRGRAT